MKRRLNKYNKITERYEIDGTTPVDFLDRSDLVDEFISYLKQSVKMPPINQEIIYRIDNNTKVIIQHVNNSRSVYIGDQKKYFKTMLVYRNNIINKYKLYYGVHDINKDREFTPEEVFNDILNTSYNGLFRKNYYEKYIYGLDEKDIIKESYDSVPLTVTLDVELDDDYDMEYFLDDFRLNNITPQYSSKYDTLKLFAKTEKAKYALCDYVCNYFYQGDCEDILELYPELNHYYNECENTFNANYITK